MITEIYSNCQHSESVSQKYHYANWSGSYHKRRFNTTYHYPSLILYFDYTLLFNISLYTYVMIFLYNLILNLAFCHNY